MKQLLLLFIGILLSVSASAQIDYFNVDGSWAGNDANGNAVIKWRITICTGPVADTNVVVAVPALERDETQSGGVGIADEDSPADESVCTGSWSSSFNTFRPADYKTTGILLDVPVFPANSCRIYSWTSYSKDYDSSASDYDHYVVANWSSDGFPDPGFICGTDGFIDCDNGSTSTTDPKCVDQIDCDDVATNNYEQIMGMAYDIVDGPNFSPDCNGGDYAFDMTWKYVVCHHGESDYEAGCDKTVPGETGAVDILPDSVTNVLITNNLINRLQSRGATVTNFVVTNPGVNQFLQFNPAWNGNTVTQMTLPSSTFPPGIDEMLNGNEPVTTSVGCMASQPQCDTLVLYLEWRPNDLTDMFNSSNEGFNCDETGNINSGNAAGTTNLFNYFHQPSLGSYVPVMGYQNPGTVGTPEGAPTEVAHRGLEPDPEYGDCPRSAFATCSAGPAEDCSGVNLQMGYYSQIMLTKNTLMVEPNFSNPNYFDVTFEIIFTNEGEVNLINPILEDDLVMTFGGDASAYILPFVTPPAIDASVVPAPSVGGGFPTVNAGYNGNGDIEILNGNGGVIEPGESVRITFEVTVDRSVLGNNPYANQAQVNAPDCFGMMSSDIWCVGDIADSPLQLLSVDVALAKTTLTPGPYTLGQTVTFNIEVINQGMSDLQNIEVTDYIPCGFQFAPSNSPTWTQNGSIATTDIAFLAMGTSTNVTIDLITQNCTDPTGWTNLAEVSYMEDEFGRDVSMVDFDSMADSNPDNDAGGAPDSDSDDSVNGNGQGSPGDTDANTDEDDADPESIDIYDLALDKVLVTPSPYNYGDLLEFTITVYNQGNQPATQIVVTDYLPDGYSFATAGNLGWSVSGANLTYTINGPLAAGTSESISLFLTLEQGTDGDSWYNEAEISSFADQNGMPAIDWDSTPDNNPDNDNDVVIDSDDDNEITENGGPGEDEDDNDPAEPEIVDAAIVKTTADLGPYSYGEDITFDMAVTNQGNVALTDVQVIEYLPCGYEFVGGNVSWGLLNGNYTTNINGPIQPGETVDITMIVTIVPCGDEGAYQNEVEIYGISGPMGEPVVDIDSTPDTDPDNDPGGEPNSPTDDVTDNTDGDEDDHDPLLIDIYDLALVKMINTPGPYSYGQTVVFDIEVFNQGNTDISNISVYDDVPSGYSYDETAGVNPSNGWSAGPNPFTVIAGPLLAGESTTVQIEMVILANPGAADAYTNYAEISSMEDGNGNEVEDADSTPDDDPTNDTGGVPGGDTDNTTGNENGDEDDQDPAFLEIFDLAIIKTPAETGPFVYGDTVTYNVNVINQGTVAANNIEVIDYLPCGFAFSTTNFPNWVYDAADNEALLVIDEVLAPGADTIVTIDVIVIPCEGADSYTNFVEIIAATDENGDPVTDVDSTPDTDPDNDAGGNPDDSTNDQTDGNGTDDEDDQDPAIIEIFDLALEKQLVTAPPYAYGDLLVFDITIENQGNVDATQIEIIEYIPPGYTYDPTEAINVANGWSSDPEPITTIAGPLAPTEFITVQIALTFTNTGGGAEDWYNYAEIAAALDGDGNTPVDADSTPDTNPDNENDVEPGDPDDGNTDGNGPNDPNGPEDEDDHDPAGPQVVDMALVKTTTQEGPFSYGDIITYEIEVTNQGNVTTNQIQVIDYIPSGLQFVGSNFPTWTFDPFSGNATAEINDDILPGESVILTMQLEVVPTTDFVDGWTNYAEIFAFEDSDGNNITNQDVDSNADATNGNDPGGEPGGTTDDEVDGDGTGPIGGGDPANDEDDHDPEFIEIFDLALAKILNTPAPYEYGQTVEFSFFVHNQGNVAATNVEITDYLPAGYSFDMTDPLNAGWAASGTDLVYTVTDIIAPATSTEVLLYLTIEMTDGGEQDWINYSEITAAQNEDGEDRTDWDIDSTPGSDGAGENAVEPGDAADDDVTSNDPGGEEDDHDPAGLEIFDLAQIKTTLETGPFIYGDEVLYTVTVYNQGSIEASSIEVTDYLPCGLSYVASNDANGWVFDGTNAVVTLPGTLVPGASTTIDITLEVTQCLDSDPASFTNVTEITGSESEDPDEPADDIDSTEDTDPDNDGPVTDNETEGDPNDPTNPDEDDSDPEVIDIFDLAQIKTLVTPGPYAYGDLLEFEFTVCNQGNVDAQSIEVTDYLPAGYSYSAAANSGWVENGTDLVYALQGILPQDECTNFTLFLTIEMTDGGELDWVNYSEITNADDDANPTNDPPIDADSTPGSDGPGENAIEPNEAGDDDLDSVDPDGNEDDHDPAGIEVFDLAQTKTTLETGPFVYGQEVLYTVTVYNQGSIEASSIEVTDYLPCGLSYVASNDANGWSFDGTNATVTLPGTLVPGASTTIDITLEVTQCLDSDPASFTNVTEITGSESEDPDEPADDIDSTEDDDPDNDGPPTDDEINGIGSCADCRQTVVIPLNDATIPPVVDEVFVDGMLLPLPNYPYDLRIPAEAAQFLADCQALGYVVTEVLAPDNSSVSITVEYPGVEFNTVSLNTGEEFTFSCSECLGPDPDEDDSDPEVIDIFDLAQIKTLVTPGPYAYGDLLEFEFTVCNQGNVDAHNIEVTDYVPAGYSYSAAVNSGWVENGTDLVYALSGILPADSCANFTLFLTIEMTDGGELDWVNYSEITNADDDANPTNDPPIDADSTPGSDGPGENAIEPNEAGDDDLESVDPDGNEDDHDPAGIEVFDLAQIKTTDAVGPFAYGDVLTYTVTVYNQGSIEASSIEVVDYLPCGLAYTAANNANGWDYDSGLNQATITLPGTLVPGDSVSVDILLELQQCLDSDPASFTNVTEITGSESEDPDEPADDIDSTEDDDPDNDGPSTDDETDGDPNDPTNPDEDDSDPEVVEIFDLAHIKTLVTPGPYAYGDLLEFEFTVCNQGNIDAQGIEVTDYVPAGYSYSAAANSGWVENGTDLVYALPGILPQDECTNFTLFLTIEMTDGGELDWVNYSEITAADDDADPTNEPPVDADSTPGSDSDAENGIEPNEAGDDDLDSVEPDGNQDDHDPAGIEIFDLAQIKTTEATPPYAYGDLITYDITIYNQGSIEASNIEITDYLPCGLGYAAANNANGWMYDATIDQATLIVPGTLLPGDSVTVQIISVLQQCIDMVPESFQNFTEISGADSEDPDEPADDIDSTPDNDPDNDGPVTDDETGGDPNDPTNPDEDDHDPMLIEVFDLALIKNLVTPGPYAYGDLVEFEITVCNQGFVNAQSIEVTDYSPPGYSFDPANNMGWTAVGDNNVYQVPGMLAADECTTFSLFLTIEQTGGGEQDWINYAEITAADDDDDPTNEPPVDADSTPGSDTDIENGIEPGDAGDDDLFSVEPDGNQDDHDPAGLEIFDLAQTKTTLETGPFSFGQEVTYTVTVFNQGSIAASSIEVTDYLPCGLAYVASNDAAGWVLDEPTNNATVTLPGSLEPGASTTVDIVLQIVPCYTDEAAAWTNVTEITGSESDDPDEPADDIDSTEDDDPDNDGPVTDDETEGDPNDPTNPDEDDSDPETIELFDLAFIKFIDNEGPYDVGEVAMFELEVTNQGNVDAYNVEITDYLNNGFIFNAADNAGWSVSGSNLVYTIAGPIAPGVTVPLTLNLEVTVPVGATVNSWYNEAEISSADDDTDGTNAPPVDVDSTPDNDPDNDNDLVDGPDEDPIFNPTDDNDNVINEDPSDPFGLGDDDEDDNDAAGILVVGGLGDTVWKDLNGNGIQDAGEPGVPNVVVILSDCEGNELGIQLTDADGFYFFNNLLPGDYQVQFDISGLPAGCAFTQQNVGDDELDSDVDFTGLAPCTTIQGGEYDSTFDAGLLSLVNIGDFVWHDLDGDGAQDPGEPGIPGVDVFLYDDDNNLIATTTTDANGEYLFTDLYPGTYYIAFGDPEGFEITEADATADNNDSDVTNFVFNPIGSTTDLFTIEFGQDDDLTFDAGYYMCIPIGQYVWYDYVENNIRDVQENGINGVPVNIYKLVNGTWELFDETATGGNPDPNQPSDDGYWKFCVPPGRYYIEVEYPEVLGAVTVVANANGYQSLTATNESTIDSDLSGQNGRNTTESFTVTSGQMVCNIGAGFYPEARLGNLVWFDQNANGLQEANEPRMANVLVEAFSEEGLKVDEAVTDEQGTYELGNMKKESYYLKFHPPSGYGATQENAGDDELDSDIDNSNGFNTTKLYQLEPGQVILSVDAGLLSGVLPVEWLSVDAAHVNDHNLITWTTGSELNSDYFEVERRHEADSDFAMIGKVDGAGSSKSTNDYKFEDYDLQSGLVYYRIKQIDLDGQFDYSEIVSVRISTKENKVTVSPNPAVASSWLNIQLVSGSDAAVQIFDAGGRLIRSHQLISEDGETITNRLKIDNLTEGVYNIRVVQDTYSITNKLIILR